MRPACREGDYSSKGWRFRPGVGLIGLLMEVGMFK